MTPTATAPSPAHARLRLVLAAALAFGAGAGRATAQPTPTSTDRAGAKAAFARGNTLFNLAEYDAAIEAFKESYKLAPAPLLLFNIAQAYRLKGACIEASRFYASYLREQPDAKDRARVEKRIAEMDACAATQPPPVEEPPVAPPPVAPPPSEPTPSEPTPSAAAAPPVDAPPPAAVLVAPVPRDRGRGLRLGGLAAVGVGVAAVGGGAYLSMRAHDLGQELEQACADGCTAADVLDHDRRGADAERNATIAYGAGGVAIAVGVGLYLVGRGRAGAAAPAIAVVPTGRGALVSAGWTLR